MRDRSDCRGCTFAPTRPRSAARIWPRATSRTWTMLRPVSRCRASCRGGSPRPSGRSGVGLTSHGPMGAEGFDDDDRRAPSRQLLGHALGEKLGRLVGTDHVLEPHRARLVPRRAVLGNAERADGRGVDDALRPPPRPPLPGCGACPPRWRDRARASRAPTAGSPRPRDTPCRTPCTAAWSEAGSSRSPSAISTAHPSSAGGLRPSRASTRTVRPPQKLADEVGADEPSAAGDERIHGGAAYAASRASESATRAEGLPRRALEPERAAARTRGTREREHRCQLGCGRRCP